MLALLLVWGSPTPASAAPGPTPEAAAEALVRSYLEAAQDGDTERMRTLLGDPLLARLARVLDNPTYGDFLREHYRGSSFQIDGVDVLSKRAVAVAVQIELGDGSAVATRFLVTAGSDGDADLRICDELEGP
jgi:hypothetical protein